MNIIDRIKARFKNQEVLNPAKELVQEVIEPAKNDDVSDEEFELVYKIKDEILPTIKDKTNELMNIDYMKYLNNL